MVELYGRVFLCLTGDEDGMVKIGEKYVKIENTENLDCEQSACKMSVGKISEFDVKTGIWTAYVERLEMYFVANSVKDEIKLPTLIAAMGERAYELLSTLASSKKPMELTYVDAVVLLRNHLQPKPSPMAERYSFRQRRQTDSESNSDYVAALRKLSRHCEFGAVLQDNLRDQLVCGLRSDVIRQRLFAEEKLLSYDKAVILAGSLEAAEREAALVESSAAVTSSRTAGQLRGEGGGGANGGLNAMRVGQRVRHTRHSAVADALSRMISTHKENLPRQIVSDNGPPFTSQEFQLFLKDNGIEYIFSAPYHPASNGAAENVVRMGKRVIKKALVQGVNIDIALNRFLLVYRNTEHCTTGVSPAKLLQGRSLRTRLDCLKPELRPRVRREQARQARAAGGSRRQFAPGDRVWYRDYRNSVVKWLKGEVHSRLRETDYNILGADKVFIHRHVDQIRPRSGEPDREGEDRDVSEGGRSSLSRSYLVYPNGSSPVVEEEAGSSGREAAAGSAPAATSPRPPPAPQPAPAAPGPARERPNPPRTRRAPRRYGFDFD
ncbi:unnamed protein product [Parnassius mnemosyne]|uniref:Integrase catalytic domain-containing protein n=1 Tax=Parnassius mnemosyne TaxID=213953 RepID=A0AAV1LMV1_9NEOP